MVALREYVLSVSASALLCGILCAVCSDFSGSSVIRLVSGLALTIAVICPLLNVRFRDFSASIDDMHQESELAAQEGVDYAKQAVAQLIKQRTEAYILDKAALYEADVTVEIVLSDDRIPIPTHVTITGNLSPYAKRQLMAYMESDLGIPKESQRWISS